LRETIAVYHVQLRPLPKTLPSIMGKGRSKDGRSDVSVNYKRRAGRVTFALGLLDDEPRGGLAVGAAMRLKNKVAGETPLLATFMGEDTPEMRAKFLSTIPIGRLSTPEDLGNAACYLCSDEASMVTGVCMEVDGGRCI
jgi:Enoyl-(Acyl carrier protein) reductase